MRARKFKAVMRPILWYSQKRGNAELRAHACLVLCFFVCVLRAPALVEGALTMTNIRCKGRKEIDLLARDIPRF